MPPPACPADEHCDIREWVLHHAQLGAGKRASAGAGGSPCTALMVTAGAGCLHSGCAHRPQAAALRRSSAAVSACQPSNHATVLCCAGKFYVFDTGSDPPMEPVLEDLVASGLVHYSYLTNTTTEIKLEAPPPGRSFNWQVRTGAHLAGLCFNAETTARHRKCTRSYCALVHTFKPAARAPTLAHARSSIRCLPAHLPCCAAAHLRLVFAAVRPAAPLDG